MLHCIARFNDFRVFPEPKLFQIVSSFRLFGNHWHSFHRRPVPNTNNFSQSGTFLVLPKKDFFFSLEAPQKRRKWYKHGRVLNPKVYTGIFFPVFHLWGWKSTHPNFGHKKLKCNVIGPKKFHSIFFLPSVGNGLLLSFTEPSIEKVMSGSYKL